jgi:hypothetical protein
LAIAGSAVVVAAVVADGVGGGELVLDGGVVLVGLGTGGVEPSEVHPVSVTARTSSAAYASGPAARGVQAAVIGVPCRWSMHVLLPV